MKQFETFHQSATVSVTKDGERVCDGWRKVSTASYTWTCESPRTEQFRKNGLAGVGMTLEKVYDWEWALKIQVWMCVPLFPSPFFKPATCGSDMRS